MIVIIASQSNDRFPQIHRDEVDQKLKKGKDRVTSNGKFSEPHRLARMDMFSRVQDLLGVYPPKLPPL
jgi:hypothetical protein